MTEFFATDREGRSFPSKKAFKEAVSTDNAVLTNVGIDDIFNDPTTLISSAELNEYLTTNRINVTGPDPRTNRKWYANVLSNGNKLVVK